MRYTRLFIASLLAISIQACGGASNPLVTVEINADSICAAVGIKNTCAQMLPAKWVIDDRAIAGLTLHSLAVGYSEVWTGGPPGKNGVQLAFDKVSHPSQFIVVEQGGNDAYGNYPVDRYETELRKILTHIIAIGGIPVVTGIVPFKAGPPGFDIDTVNRAIVLNEIVHRVAAELGVRDAHWDTAPFNPATDTIDGIHRTEAALRELVLRLQKAIE